MRSLTLLLVAGLLLAACAPGGDQGEGGGDGTPPVSTDPAEQPPVLESGAISGAFGGDAQLEGGCAWVEAGGTRYEVLWPEGYVVQHDPLQLVGPDGQAVAGEGDLLRVTGQEATDMMSICQVGPLWQAEGVEVVG